MKRKKTKQQQSTARPHRVAELRLAAPPGAGPAAPRARAVPSTAGLGRGRGRGWQLASPLPSSGFAGAAPARPAPLRPPLPAPSPEASSAAQQGAGRRRQYRQEGVRPASRLSPWGAKTWWWRCWCCWWRCWQRPDPAPRPLSTWPPRGSARPRPGTVGAAPGPARPCEASPGTERGEPGPSPQPAAPRAPARGWRLSVVAGPGAQRFLCAVK